jgi:ABC-2 type transport system permease protein
VGIIVVCYCCIQLHIPITFLTIVEFIIMLFVSLAILYSFWFMVMTITLWHSNLENLANLLYDTNHITRFPPEMYKGASTLLLIILFPLTFIMVTPTKILLEKATLPDVLWPLFFALIMFWGSRKFWLFALRYYTSASG